MKGRKIWILIIFCLLMVAGAVLFMRQRNRSIPSFSSHGPAPVSWFAPRQRPAPEHSVAHELNNELSDAVARVMPSVVVIRTEKVQYRKQQVDPLGFYYRVVPEQLAGEGSGVIIDDRGHVLTCWHVIKGAKFINVVLNDGTKLVAKEVGHDEATDLAVVQFRDDTTNYPAVEFGDSDALRVGEMVIAIGSPFSLQSSVTVGHVSQKGRRMHVLPYEDFIQTDAAINEGNSGGPLIDVDGRLVGINSRIWTEATGIAFAVPGNLAMAVAKSLIENGKQEWPWVGARFGTTGMPGDTRLQVTQINRDTPAARVGMQVGDVVLKVDGKAVKDEYDVLRIIFNHSVGEKVSFLIQRDEKKQLKFELPLVEYTGPIF